MNAAPSHQKEMLMTAADIRSELARKRWPLYQLAATIGLHPSRLGAMLNEHVPLPPDVAERVAAALDTRRELAMK
jgi:plasmid maintenance system antidote protein VapI